MWRDSFESDEGGVSYRNTGVRFQSGPPPPPPPPRGCLASSPPPPPPPNNTISEPSNSNRQIAQPQIQTSIPTITQETKKESENGCWKNAVFAVGILIALLLTAMVVQLSIFMSSRSASSPSATATTTLPLPVTTTTEETPKSCRNIHIRGERRSGLYLIKPDSRFPEYQVYCDMETEGGGWTLVASIHEDDITRKCSSEDRWASFVPTNEVVPTEKTSWENKRVFGEVANCTMDDYKNSAYYALDAQNVMVWHVPSDESINTMRNQSTMRYRTTNNFLQKTGGNLKSLFTEYYPLKVKKGYQTYKETKGRERAKLVIKSLEKYASRIRSHISNWDSYSYGGSTDYRFEESSLFPSYYGNQVSFYSPVYRPGRLSYEYDYAYLLSKVQLSIATKKSQPFIMVSAIENEKGASEYFKIHVDSWRSGSDSYTVSTGTVTSGNFQLEFRSPQFYNRYSGYPTLCVYQFIVYNEKEWRSKRPASFDDDGNTNSGNSKYARYRVNGSPSNFVYGYVLLSRSGGRTISTTELRSVGNVILEAISSIPKIFNDYPGSNGLVVPITFDRGHAGTLQNSVPAKIRDFTDAGFLQFRAYNQSGYTNAICPGVKIRSLYAEHACIGGLSNDIGIHGTCGDFSGWAGNETQLSASPVGYAHSQNDISSAILIFYR